MLHTALLGTESLALDITWHLAQFPLYFKSCFLDINRGRYLIPLQFSKTPLVPRDGAGEVPSDVQCCTAEAPGSPGKTRGREKSSPELKLSNPSSAALAFVLLPLPRRGCLWWKAPGTWFWVPPRRGAGALPRGDAGGAALVGTAEAPLAPLHCGCFGGGQDVGAA